MNDQTKLTNKEIDLERTRLQLEKIKAKTVLKEVSKPVQIGPNSVQVLKKNTPIKELFIRVERIKWVETTDNLHFRVYITDDLYYNFVYDDELKMNKDLLLLL